MKNNKYKFRIYQSKEKYYAQKLVKGLFGMRWKHLEYDYYGMDKGPPKDYRSVDSAMKEIVKHLKYSLLPSFKVIKQFTQDEILSLLEDNNEK